jgi:hypothetical protein
MWALGTIMLAIGLGVEFKKPGPFLLGTVLLLLALGFLTCWAVGSATWIWLLRFRCPRCGKRFIVTWWSSWPSDRCKHCALDLGPAKMAVAKPAGVVDGDLVDPTMGGYSP